MLVVKLCSRMQLYFPNIDNNKLLLVDAPSNATIFARKYGTAAVISYNLKGIAPPVPPVQCWNDKNLMSGCKAPTLKRVEGGRVGKM
jgi:hypothetical protein